MKKRILAFLLVFSLVTSGLYSQTAFATGNIDSSTGTTTNVPNDNTSDTVTPDSDTSDTTVPDTGDNDTTTAPVTDSDNITTPDSNGNDTTVPDTDDTDVTTPDTDDSVTDIPTSYDLTEQFVARLYETLLLRLPDAEGLADWVSQLQAGEKTGAEIVYGFINSKEFLKRNYSDDKFVDLMYKAMFDRLPDDAGKQGWLEDLSDGLSRDYVCAGFIGSNEFQKLCKKFEITPGQIELTTVTDLNPDVTRFVSYLYKNLLDRQSDPDGLADWVSQLSSHTKTASEVVPGFVFSKEFIGKNHSDEKYVSILYNTILGRNADTAGLKDWTSALSHGMSKHFVLRGFLESSEFKKLCNKYNIIAGTYTLTEARDQNRTLTEYVFNAYISCYGCTATVDELNHQTEQLLSNNYTLTDFLKDLIFIDSIKNLDYESFTILAYETILGRTPSETDIANNADLSNAKIFDNITNSAEYVTFVNEELGLSLKLEGWNITSAGKYYVKNKKVLSGWQKINGQKYYFNPNNNNFCAIGWTYIDGYKFYFDTNGCLVQNVESIIGKQSSYHLTVNTSTNTVTVFAKDGSNGYIIPVKSMICSTGASGTATITGKYKLSTRYRWCQLMGGVWGQYCTVISGSYLFHSAWFYSQNIRTLSVSEYNKLGTNASHGCVRLTVADAKWIYENCKGSTVAIHRSCAQPLDKPTRPTPVRISGDYGYDPTDPAIQ